MPVPGGTVFTRRWNPGPKAPIVLLHDSLGCVELWRDFPAALAKASDRPVIAYDRLGFGRSSARTALPAPGFIREEAETIFPAVCDALGVKEALLFGHSVGGGMALTIAALRPDRCRAVVSESAQAFVEPRTLEAIRAAKKHFAAPENFVKLGRLHGAKAAWVLAAWTEVWLSPAFASWRLEGLAEVRCPVLAIHGGLDEFGSLEFPRRIAGTVKGPAELQILAGCGHVPHRERRAEVLRLASSFYARRG